MRITFVSNYINHHQIPFCRAMIGNLSEGDQFTFIQTQEMEDDRKKMGWDKEIPEFVRLSYISDEEKKACRELIFESEVVIFGGCEDESYIAPRLEALKEGSADDKKYLTFRYSERVYKDGQWKFITPRGLRKKYLDHTRYNDLPVYLLCSGGYVASDFSLFGAYKGKKYKWGYFPEVKSYDIDSLFEAKGYGHVNILWSGRMLDWKHPEFAVLTAKYLKDKGYDFTMDIVGDGPEKDKIRGMAEELGLLGRVKLSGFKKPEEIRSMMEKADIYLFTSDRKEGWGAVLNESMNSGCAVVAGSMIGAVPYLLKDGENGFVYKNKDTSELFEKCERLVTDGNLRKRLGKVAYETVIELWNPETAAKRLKGFIDDFFEGKDFEAYKEGPLSPDEGGAEATISKKAAGH